MTWKNNPYSSTDAPLRKNKRKTRRLVVSLRCLALVVVCFGWLMFRPDLFLIAAYEDLPQILNTDSYFEVFKILGAVGTIIVTVTSVLGLCYERAALRVMNAVFYAYVALFSVQLLIRILITAGRHGVDVSYPILFNLMMMCSACFAIWTQTISYKERDVS